MKALDLLKTLTKGLSVEKKQEIYWLFEDILGKKITNIYMEDQVLSPTLAKKITELSKIPYAYYKGAVDFLGYEIDVDSSVLIPRPETAEMVTLCLEEIKRSRTRKICIWEVGVGSGCIGISLISELIKAKKHVTYYGTDISEAALNTAEKNFTKYFAKDKKVKRSWKDKHYQIALDKPEIFIEALHPTLIISNPPYLTENEYKSNKELVHEPKIALVAEDEGLRVYEEIAGLCSTLASKTIPKLLFLELSPTVAEKVRDMFKPYFESVGILTDSFGKLRFLVGKN